MIIYPHFVRQLSNIAFVDNDISLNILLAIGRNSNPGNPAPSYQERHLSPATGQRALALPTLSLDSICILRLTENSLYLDAFSQFLTVTCRCILYKLFSSDIFLNFFFCKIYDAPVWHRFHKFNASGTILLYTVNSTPLA